MQEAQNAIQSLQNHFKELDPKLSRYNDMQRNMQTIANALNEQNEKIQELQKKLRDGNGS